MTPRERLVVALDRTDRDDIVRLANSLAEHVGVFKLGSIPFLAHGPDLVRELSLLRPVFLDVKLHDIPNTVAGGVAAAADLSVQYLTVHAAGGEAMLAAAAAARRDGLPRLLAVTVLTSFAENDLRQIGIERALAEQVEALARLANQTGMDGMVCSAHEVAAVRSAVADQRRLVVPGIRPTGAEVGDQRRVATPGDAIAAGADLLVVGRPILDAADPVSAAQELVAEIAAAG